MHQAVLNDCIGIRVLIKQCDSYKAAVLLYRCRSETPGIANQKLQKSIGLCGKQDA